MDEGSTNTLSVLNNNTDPDDALAPASLQVLVGPTAGVATALPTGQITYTHSGSETQEDPLVYTVCDSLGACGEAQVDLVIIPVNDLPVLILSSGVVDEGATWVLTPADLTATDSDHPAEQLDLGGLAYAHSGDEHALDRWTLHAEDPAGGQNPPHQRRPCGP